MNLIQYVNERNTKALNELKENLKSKKTPILWTKSEKEFYDNNQDVIDPFKSHIIDSYSSFRDKLGIYPQVHFFKAILDLEVAKKNEICKINAIKIIEDYISSIDEKLIIVD